MRRRPATSAGRAMRFIADLHIHSYLSRATRKDLTLEGWRAGRSSRGSRWSAPGTSRIRGGWPSSGRSWSRRSRGCMRCAGSGAAGGEAVPAARAPVPFLLQIEVEPAPMCVVRRPRTPWAYAAPGGGLPRAVSSAAESSSKLVVARGMSRRVIGIEIEERWCEWEHGGSSGAIGSLRHGRPAGHDRSTNVRGTRLLMRGASARPSRV